MHGLAKCLSKIKVHYWNICSNTIWYWTHSKCLSRQSILVCTKCWLALQRDTLKTPTAYGNEIQMYWYNSESKLLIILNFRGKPLECQTYQRHSFERLKFLKFFLLVTSSKIALYFGLLPRANDWHSYVCKDNLFPKKQHIDWKLVNVDISPYFLESNLVISISILRRCLKQFVSLKHLFRAEHLTF